MDGRYRLGQWWLPITHPSWMGHLTIFATREVVYYKLSRTPRSAQKCFWSNLRVEFLGENHLLLICGKIPNQTFWITKYLESGLNFDLFKKKVCPNRTCLDCFRYHFLLFFENGSHFWTAINLQLVHMTKLVLKSLCWYISLCIMYGL